MTDKEIIKALEYCVGEEYTCENCPFQEIKHYDYENEMFEIMPNGKQYDDWSCERWLNVAVLNLIKRQQAEIEKLKGWENLLKAESHAPIKAKARAEAINEFAERLCEERVSNDPVAIAVKVELKEMVGEGE